MKQIICMYDSFGKEIMTKINKSESIPRVGDTVLHNGNVYMVAMVTFAYDNESDSEVIIRCSNQ